MIRKSGKKKFAAILLVFALLIALAACAGQATTTESAQPTEESSATTAQAETTTRADEETTESTSVEIVEDKPDVIRVAALKGPTGMGMAQMVDQFDQGNLDQNYEFTFAGSPDELTAGLISGQLDIAALPTNLASVLYHKTEKDIQLLAINTLGVLYILENGNEINSFADLEGKTILATGLGAVPEYVLSSLIADYGLNNVNVEYKTEHAELATLAISGQADLVMLPEPFVTNVLGKNEDMRRALDLTEVWQENQANQGTEGDLAMGCLVVGREFAQKYPQALAEFLATYQQSTEFVNTQAEEAGEIIAKYEIIADAELAAKAIPNCYITLITGDEMQAVLLPLFETLLEANPQSVGGSLPDADFYYGAND